MKLNGHTIISGRIDLPRVGIWSADLVVDADDVAKLYGRKVSLDLDGALVLTGTVIEGSTFVGQTRVKVAGGAGGFGVFLYGKDYKDAPARIPIGDALTESGETLSSTADGAMLGVVLPSWTRPAATAGHALALLMAKLGASWRVLPDGSVWLGTETWPASKATKVLILDEDGASGRLHVHSDQPNILPGTTLEGRKVSKVAYVIRPDFFEAIVYVERVGTRSTTLLEHLARVVNVVMARVDFHAMYPARVVMQHADGSLDLTPDDKRMPDKSKVGIRLGLPGVRVKVSGGARVLLGFENGDPARPFAALWEYDAMTEISLGGGQQGVARIGDVVSLSLPPGTAFINTGGGPVPTFVNAAPIRCTGTILTGSAKVKA